MKIRCAVMMATSALAFNAQASPTNNWGEHDAVETARKVTPIGTFAGNYLFSLTASSTSLNATLVNKHPGEHAIQDGVVKLYEEAGQVDRLVGQFAFRGPYGTTRHTFGELDAGDYYYRIRGNGVGARGGLYTITSSMAAPTAIPEPATYALLLGGLGVIGVVARRRRPGNASG